MNEVGHRRFPWRRHDEEFIRLPMLEEVSIARKLFVRIPMHVDPEIVNAWWLMAIEPWT